MDFTFRLRAAFHPVSLAAVVLLACLGGGSCAPPPAGPRITNLGEILKDADSGTAGDFPVQVIGRLTFIDEIGKRIIVQDAEAAVRVHLSGRVPFLRPGQKVAVTGFLSHETVRPALAGMKVEVVDSAIEFPVARPLASLDLETDRDDYRWVELEGEWQKAYVNAAGRDILELETSQGPVQVACFSNQRNSGTYAPGTRLQLTGVWHPVRSLQGERLRTEIWLVDWSSIRSPNLHPASRDDSLPRLRTVAGIRALSIQEGARGYPVSLKGIVTFLFPSRPNFFIQDSTGGVYVSIVAGNRVPGLLEEVEVEGWTVRGSFLTDIAVSKWISRGRGVQPQPGNSGIPALLDGKFRSEWVRLEGMVMSLRPATGIEGQRFSGMIALQILSEGQRLLVMVPHSETDLPHYWVGKKVQVHGVCGSIYNQRRQFSGIRVYVPDPGYLTVMESVASDSVPLQKIGQLLQVGDRGIVERWVRIRGQVTMPYSIPLEGFFLQDDTGGVLVRHSPADPLKVGEEVEVVGFPVMTDLSPVLQDSSSRSLGTSPPVFATSILAEEALRGDFHSQLVRLEGILTHQILTPFSHEMILRAGDIPFTAVLDRSPAEEAAESVRLGSLLKLTGICMVRTNENRVPESFRLLLRSPQDISVIRMASWWTSSRILGACIFSLVLAAGIFTWSVLLRKQIRRQTELIRKRERHYRSLMENAPDVVFSCDMNHRITAINQVAEKLTGYTRNELLQMSLLQLVDPADHHILDISGSHPSSGEAGNPFEIRIRTKAGAWRIMEGNLDLYFEGGKPVAKHGILRDVTERNQWQEQIREVQKLEAIGQLAGGAAHHFNNLLTVILGNSELALSKISDQDPSYKKLQAIQKAGTEASKIATHLLTFGRKRIPKGKELNVNEFITGMEDIWRSFLSRKVELILRLEQPLGLVRIDPNHFQQALTNLVVNSAYAMPDGGRLEVRTWSRSLMEVGSLEGSKEILAPGNYVLVSLKDSGVGISEEAKEHMFEPFFTTKPVGQGTGLGLSTAYGIIKQAGGTLWAQSGPGEGALFILCLPTIGPPEG